LADWWPHFIFDFNSGSVEYSFVFPLVQKASQSLKSWQAFMASRVESKMTRCL